MKKMLFFALAACAAGAAFACTTAIVTGRASADGRPMLFKNADGHESQTRLKRVFAYCPAVSNEYAYTGSVRPGWKGRGWVGCGMNEKGLAAVNNTASDLDGRKGPSRNMIGDLLRHCATVQEAAEYLRKAGPFSYGSNYGVIDAHGGAMYFECGAHGVDAFDANDPEIAPDGWLARTNFAQGPHGNTAKGSGLARYLAASNALARCTAGGGKVRLEDLMDISRSLKHGVTEVDLLKDAPSNANARVYAYFREFVPRYNTESAAIFHGVKNGENPQFAVSWVTQGNPLVSPFAPVWVRDAQAVPKCLWSGEPGVLPFADKWNTAFMDFLYPLRGYGGEALCYIRRDRLANKAGTGIYDRTVKIQKPILTHGTALSEVLRKKGKISGREIARYNTWLDMFMESEYRKTGALHGLKVEDDCPRPKSTITPAPPPADPKRLVRTALYCGAGARANNFCRWIELLSSSPDVELKFVDGAAIRAGALKEVDVLVMPGGNATVEAKEIGHDGGTNIAEFVRAGGGYIGTCAGAFYASGDSGGKRPRMAALDSANYSGRGESVFLAVDMSARGQELTGVKKGKIHGVNFHGGPLYVPGAKPVEDGESEIISTYAGTADTSGIEYAPMNGFGAQAAARYGKGRLCLFATHPEAQKGTWKLVAGAFKFTAGRAITFGKRNRKPGAPAVAVYSCLNGVKEAETYAKLCNSPDVYAFPALPKDWAAGALEHADVLLLPDGEKSQYESRVGKNPAAKAALQDFAKRGGIVFARGAGAQFAPAGSAATFDAAAIAAFVEKAKSAAKTPEKPAPSVPGAKPLKVALYVDIGAQGVNFCNWITLLSCSPDVEVHFVDGKAVVAGALEGMDVFVMPGGWSRAEYVSLQKEKGGEKVREFVRNGGAYFGTCAGAFLVLNAEGRLRMTPLRSVAYDCTRRGASSFLSLAADSRCEELIGVKKGVHGGMNYHGGPLLIPGPDVESAPAKAEMIARFAGNVFTYAACPLAMNGYGAIAACTYGKGKLVVCATHPEASARTHKFITGGFKWLTGRDVRFVRQPRNPGAIPVAFYSYPHWTDSAKALQALALSPDVDVRPASPGSWSTGALDGADVLILPDGSRAIYSDMGSGAKTAMAEFAKRGGKIIAWGEGCKYAPKGSTILENGTGAVEAVKAAVR